MHAHEGSALRPLRPGYFRMDSDIAIATTTPHPQSPFEQAPDSQDLGQRHPPTPLPLPPTLKLPFQYKGDVFGQLGVYTDASLYMSRLPSSRKQAILRPKAGPSATYKVPGAVKLAPMQPNHDRVGEAKADGGKFGAASGGRANASGARANKGTRKRQYAMAIAAMAANANLHESLLGDGVVPNILPMCRARDATTLAACVATLCHLSTGHSGREALLAHNAVSVLTTLSPSLGKNQNPHETSADEQRVLHDFLATLSNLTIEDSVESMFVKEKALACVLKHCPISAEAREDTAVSNPIRACGFALFVVFNLSCPAFSYPRVDEVIRALTELGRAGSRAGTNPMQTAQHCINGGARERLSCALYNLSCTRRNQFKLVENDVVSLLNTLLSTDHPIASSRGTSKGSARSNLEADAEVQRRVRLNALMSLWHLADNVNCRTAVTKLDCINALVAQLHRMDSTRHVQCVLLTLVQIAGERNGRDLLGVAGALESLAMLAEDPQSSLSMGQDSQIGRESGALQQILQVVYRLIALILSVPTNVGRVGPRLLNVLLSFRHEEHRELAMSSRYVLFSLACILSWNDDACTNSTRSQRATGSETTTDEDQMACQPYNDYTDLTFASRLAVAATMQSPVSMGNHFAMDHASSPATYSASGHVLEGLLEDASCLSRIYAHVDATCFPRDSPEVALQLQLVYNLSFRYNKVDVACRTAPRLRRLVRQSRDRGLLGICCRILFSLCQTYEVHPVLKSTHVLHVLPVLAQRCDADTRSLCLEIVCVIFDGRHLSPDELNLFVARMTPALVTLCANGSSRIRAGCAACLARFTTLDSYRSLLVEHGVLDSLALLANEDEVQTLRLCVIAYSYLAKDAKLCGLLIARGIIQSLTLLAAAPEEAVRRACAITLCNLSTTESHLAALTEGGALRALLVIACVKSNDAETRRVCMKAVVNLLRAQAQIPQLCHDGLLWAFALFTSTMESKDFAILSDACAALAFYPTTRRGVAKPAILSALLQILPSPDADMSTKIKLLRALSNVLCDLPHAGLLLQVGILPNLIQLVSESTHNGSNISNNGLKGFQQTEKSLRVNTVDDDTTTSESSSSVCTPTQSHELYTLVAQLLVLLLQSCPDAESEFSSPGMLHTIAQLVQIAIHGSVPSLTTDDACGKSCAVLLYQMSRHATTREQLVCEPTLLGSLPQLALRGSQETRAVIVRFVYRMSCDRALVRRLRGEELVPCLSTALARKVKVASSSSSSSSSSSNLALPVANLSASTSIALSVSMAMATSTAALEVPVLSAGLLRNLSCEPSLHPPLLSEDATTLLTQLFDVDHVSCKQDTSVCLCNLLLGPQTNSNALLARSVLPMVLWLCAQSSEEDRALGTAVMRKLALAPGNAQRLVDGGVISHLALLLQELPSRYVTTNCIATFCLLSRRTGVPELLASYGVIGVVSGLLHDGTGQVIGGGMAVDNETYYHGDPAGATTNAIASRDDDSCRFEAMCVDLLSSLAEFARSEDPRESRIASILYRLLDADARLNEDGVDRSGVNGAAASAWQLDRSFLVRESNGSTSPAPLPTPTLSVAHETLDSKPPTLRHTLYPIRFPGYEVAFTQVANHLQVRTIEAVVPQLSTLGELDVKDDLDASKETPHSSKETCESDNISIANLSLSTSNALLNKDQESSFDAGYINVSGGTDDDDDSDTGSVPYGDEIIAPMVPSSFEFTPLAMYNKICSAYPAMASSTSTASPGFSKLRDLDDDSC